MTWLRCWVVFEWWPFSRTSKSWQAGITLGPFRLMVEYAHGECDPVSVWLRLYYGDVRRTDIPIVADWEAMTK